MKTPLAALALSLALAAAPAFAGDPVPGVDVSLGQVPGGIVASAKTDAGGKVSFFNLPAGRYGVEVDNSSLAKPSVITIVAGRQPPIVSDPIPAGLKRGAQLQTLTYDTAENPFGLRLVPVKQKTSTRGYVTAQGGGAIVLIIAPADGAARGATPKAVSGPAPRDAPIGNTITVTLTYQ